MNPELGQNYSQDELPETLVVDPENHSVVNLPNLTTFIGVASSIYGAKHIDERKGIVAFGLGRFADYLDGKIARSLHQETQSGKFLDHTSDKIAMFAVLYQAWKKDIGPKTPLATIAGINIANAGITLTALKNKPGQELSANKSGKRFMAAQAMAMTSYMLAEKVRHNHSVAYGFLRFTGHTAASISIIYGLRSTIEYAQWLKKSPEGE